MLVTEKAMAPHSSTLAWKIPWTEEPGRLQSMGWRRVRHDWATSLSRIGEGNGNPLQCSCLENPRDGGAWWAAIYGVPQSWIRLKRLRGSSSKMLVKGRPTIKGTHKNNGQPVNMGPYLQEYEKLIEHLKCWDFLKGNLGKLQSELYKALILK